MERIRFRSRNENRERKELFQDQIVQYGKLLNGEITLEEFRKEKKLTREKIAKLNNELKKMREELRETISGSNTLDNGKPRRTVIAPFNFNRSKAF